MRFISRGGFTCCCLVASLASAALAAAGGGPVRNLQVTLRGKKYDVEEGVTTVKELTERLKEVSGVSSDQSVLFGGKRLDSTDVLSDVGVSDGAELSMVPTTSKSSSGSGGGSSKPKSKKASAAASASASTGDKTASAAAGGDSIADTMKDYLKGAGVDTDKLEEMVKGMGGGTGGAGGGMPDMKESMDMMSGVMNSPMFKEYMNDPEKLEQSRQMILQNDMLKSMMAGMPGMEELLNDKDAWREAMQAASNLYQNMDQDQLMKMMQGGAPGGGMGMPPGMGGGAGGAAGDLFGAGTLDQSATAKALDELEEDD